MKRVLITPWALGGQLGNKLLGFSTLAPSPLLGCDLSEHREGFLPNPSQTPQEPRQVRVSLTCRKWLWSPLKDSPELPWRR